MTHQQLCVTFIKQQTTKLHQTRSWKLAMLTTMKSSNFVHSLPISLKLEFEMKDFNIPCQMSVTECIATLIDYLLWPAALLKVCYAVRHAGPGSWCPWHAPLTRGRSLLSGLHLYCHETELYQSTPTNSILLNHDYSNTLPHHRKCS